MAAMADMKGYQLPVIESYIDYDGPAVFLTKIGFEEYLVSKADMWDDGYILIASSVEGRVVSLLKDNRLSLLGAFRSGDFVVIETGYDFTVSRYWSVDIESVDQDMLPVSGKPIAFDIGKAADTVDQAEAYFSIRLSGENLNKESMSFHQFKKMIDKAYSAARNLLAPEELRSARAGVYDFRITEPEFGSLVINIEAPSLPSLENARDIFEKEDIDNKYVEGKFDDARIATIKNLAYLKEATKDGVIDGAEAAKLGHFLQDVADIFPSQRDAYSNIEFSVFAGGHQEFFSLDEKDVKAVNSAIYDHNNRPQEILGVITIINEKSGTVVLSVPGRRDITCEFSMKHFKQMNEDENFKTGSNLRVRGVIWERTYRDLMNCNQAGDVSLP